MKRILILLSVFLILSGSVQATEEYRTEKGTFSKQVAVMGRGIINVLGMPMEFATTFIRERETYNRLWPVTYPFRAATNVLYRITSAVNDVFIYPWAVPFTNDITPWTEAMGLPEYPWQIE